MKNIYLIGGTMGVGKTTICRIMKQKLENSVFLDGDWCWDMHPFQVTDETKQMVIGNICFLLNSFIKCSAFEHIVFCWVMHEQGIIDEILSHLDTTGFRVHLISLVCDKQALQARLGKDVDAGIRAEDIVSRSTERIPLYETLSTVKVDVSNRSPEQAADFIIENCQAGGIQGNRKAGVPMRKPLSEMTLQELWKLFPIQLTKHKEYWESWYQAEQVFLSSFLQGTVRIYHIGSTSINDIWAKPIIDILVEAPIAEHEIIKGLLLKNRYVCMAQSKNRIDFNKGYTPDGFAERVFHLHLRDFGDHDELYFRDYLNENPEIAKEYEKLKLSLWKPFEHDRDGYTERKTDFVRKYTQIAIDQYGKEKYQ